MTGNLATAPPRDPHLIEDAERIERQLSRDGSHGAAQLIPRLLRALRDAQQFLELKEQQLDQRECDMREMSARLSSPPPERAEIVERQHINRQEVTKYGFLCTTTSHKAADDIDTLLGDCAAWRNAHALVTAERDQLKAAKLKHDSQQRVAALALHDERIERLQAALRMVLLVLGVSDRGLTAEQQAQVDLALAAADGQQT